MTLRYDQIADLIKIIDASACDELVLETADLKLVVRRRHAGVPADQPTAVIAQAGAAVPELGRSPPPPSAPSRQVSAPNRAGGTEVRSPMVGTFHRAPSPDAAPFVEVGTVVAAGQPLGIIEVMKLFTTIYAEVGGRVAEIGANNAELVDYGQVLFILESTQGDG